MKKQTALRLSAAMFFFAVGYVALAFRVYYTDPAVHADPDIPASVVWAMLDAEQELDFLKPEPFTWSGVLHHLMYPWEADMREVEMMWVCQPIPLPSGELHPKADRGMAWIEIPDVGGLRGDLTHGMDGIENVRITPPFQP